MGCNPTPSINTSNHTSSTPKSTEAILKLDTKGHTALINDIIVTKSGDIISASDDKTIRVWDSATGKEKRKILTTTKDDNTGKVYAIALSKNEKFLAVGGYLAGEKLNRYVIRIYNYNTGKLLKILKSHSDVILDLQFSKDGKYLISGSADRAVKIWDSSTFLLNDTIKFHTNHINAVNMIDKDGTPFVVSIGNDKKIALYNLKTRKIIKVFKSKDRFYYLAVSSKHIAVAGYNKEIQIYDYSLNIIKTIHSRANISSLSFSPSGKYLLVGTIDKLFNIDIYNSKLNYKRDNLTSFKKHTNVRSIRCLQKNR
jgi:WD40 repeat protein